MSRTLVLIEIVASLTLLTISQAYGESLTGYGEIQSAFYLWKAEGEFVVGKPIDITLDIDIPMPSYITILELDLGGCGVNNTYDLHYDLRHLQPQWQPIYSLNQTPPFRSVLLYYVARYHFECEVVPSQVGGLFMDIIIGFNCTSSSVWKEFYSFTGNVIKYSGRGPNIGDCINVFSIKPEPSVSQTTYNLLQSQYDSLNANYKNLQTENVNLHLKVSQLSSQLIGLELGIVLTGALAVMGFILYFIEKGKTKTHL